MTSIPGAVETSTDPVGVRVQRMSTQDQVLVLGSIASGRSENGTTSGAAVRDLFHDSRLPMPSRIDNAFAALRRAGWATPGKARGSWAITPLGRQRVSHLLGADSPQLLAATPPVGADFGHSHHALLPGSLAPPQLVRPVADFTATSPAETHVFGMTRFPDEDEDPDGPDPMAAALVEAELALPPHGLRLLLASQRALVDDLWGNVAAHMWASSFGIAFFEDRRGRGMNYNLVIEVGAMLMSGRRCLLLKDSSIKKMPTDLVGMIYKSVDVDDPASIASAVHDWVREDLSMGACPKCQISP